jgi:glycogen operon protein
MIWLNARHDAVEVELPANEWVHSGEVALSTDPELPTGHPVEAGKSLRLGGRTVVVLRQTDSRRR